MKLITTRDLIRDVADRWGALSAPYFDNDRHRDVLRRLRTLDADTATAAEVNAIIGNDSWTYLKCGECQNDVGAVVQFGDDPDCDTLNLCVDCAAQAVALFTGATA